MARKKQVLRNGVWVDEEVAEQVQDAADGVRMGNGRLQRAGAGRRSLFDFFDQDNKDKPITRGEVLGFVQALEWHRRENVWYRKLWRWVNRRPGPRDLPANLAAAHTKTTVKPMVEAVQAKIEQDIDKATLDGMAP